MAVNTKKVKLKKYITKFDLPWNSNEASQFKAMFNIKNERCLKVFKMETSKNNKLSKVFDEEKDLDTVTENVMKKLNKLLHKCSQ